MPRIHQLTRLSCAVGMLLICAWIVGCGGKSTSKAKPNPLASRYAELPPRNVPPFLKDTLLERCELQNANPFPVSGYAVVGKLRGTGDTTAGNAVREYVRKMLVTHGFGSTQYGYETVKPEDLLRDPHFAIVRVDGLLPPGARRHERFDVYVRALDGNDTSSLAHGMLYRTELKQDGANTQQPGWRVDVMANAEGALFVNPAYALVENPSSQEERASLRRATVLNGGIVLMDRPLVLRLRKPQLSISRTIELRIDQRFQNANVASARDEALIAFFVPQGNGEEWEHFAQVVMHLYLNASPDFAILKARELAAEAVKPDAPLLDISYCWEGLGPTVLPFITPLIANEKPEVSFAAARAATLLRDSSALGVLMEIARNPAHPFQLNAVQTLGKLPSSPVVNQLLRALLDSKEALVRIEAYRALAAHDDPIIVSRPIMENKFRLDIVPSQGPPLIYVTRTGMPRIAIIGNKPRVNMPMFFSALDNRLTINSEPNRELIQVFYRGQELPEPVSILSSPDLAEFIARLGGEGAPGDKRLDFNYGDVVALLQMMTDQKRLSAQTTGQRSPVAFVLQEAPSVEDQLREAPAIPDEPPPPEPDKPGAAAESGMNAGGLK